MSKFCFNCSNELADSALFCTNCGSKQPPPPTINIEPTFVAPVEESVTDPTIHEPVFQPPLQASDSIRNTPPYQQYYQPPVAPPPEPPKKNKTAVTVAVCAVILCVVLIASVAILIMTGVLSYNKTETKETEEKSEIISEITEDVTDRTYNYNIENNGEVTLPESTTNAIIDNTTGLMPYSKGEVINGEYVNEWAGFKFEIPADYPEVDAATYNSLNANLPAGEYGFIAMNETDGTLIGICFENNTSNYSLEEIFNSSIDLAQSMTESYNPLTYGSIEEIKLCGDDYLYSTMYYSVSQSYGITLMRLLDNKLISIVITGETLSQCYSFLNTIEKATPSI